MVGTSGVERARRETRRVACLAGLAILMAVPPATSYGYELRVPVLMYHRITKAPADARLPQLWVAPRLFRAQLRALKDRGWRTITAEELARAVKGHRTVGPKRFVITVDDGARDGYTNAAPILERLSMRATFCVVPGRAWRPWQLSFRHMRWLREDGHEIANHSLDHADLPSLSRERLRRQVFKARRLIEERVGHAPRTFCYPYGRHDRTVRRVVARAGHLLAFTTVDGARQSTDDPMRSPRIRVNGSDRPAEVVARLRPYAKGGGPRPSGAGARARLSLLAADATQLPPAAVDGSSPSPAVPSACWEPVELPVSAEKGWLTDLFTADGSAWIVGLAPRGSENVPIALRRDGDGWQETSVPWQGSGGLVGGDAKPGVGTWAVGFARPAVKRPGLLDLDVSAHPIAGRWQEDHWEDITVTGATGQGAALTDVAVLPSGRVWAVGTRLSRGRTRALALRWDGRWRRSDPAVGVAESGLTGVTSAPDGSVWAVGWQMLDGVTRPLLVRRSAGRWHESRVVGIADGQAVLSDIDFRSDDDGYASGYLIPAGSSDHVPLLLHWDGTGWTTLDLPWARSHSAVIHSVAAGEGDALLVTGARVAGNAAWTRAFLARHADGRWEVRRADPTPYQNSELTDGDFEPGEPPGQPMVVGGHAGWTMALAGCPRLARSRSGGAAESAESAAPSDPDAAGPSTRGAAESTARPSPGPTGSAAAGRSARPVRFVDVAAAVGLAEVTDTWGGVSADFDRDGWPDVFYSRHDKLKPRLLLGGPTGFREAVEPPLRDRDRHGCAAADVDADGWPDLFCVHGAALGSKMTSNELWLRPAAQAAQATADFGLVDPFGRGRQAAFLDLDGDPYPELYVTNEPERVDGRPSLNRLYRNDGGNRFVAAPELGLDRSMGGVCATSGDVDGDGDDDLLVCTTERWRGLPRGLRVFRNEGGSLRDATTALGLRPIGDQDVVMADFDGAVGQMMWPSSGRIGCASASGTGTGFDGSSRHPCGGASRWERETPMETGAPTCTWCAPVTGISPT